MMKMTEQDWDMVLAVNLKGTFNFTKAATRYMMKARYGKIVNIASVVGRMGNAGQANYSASKAGVIGLTKTSARVRQPQHLRECDRSRIHHHGYDRKASAGGARCIPREHSAETRRQT